MDHQWVRLVAGHRPRYSAFCHCCLRIAACLLLCLLPAACGGGFSGTPFPTARGPIQQISAQWLQAQPGQRVGELSFHLLDAQGKALARWPGLRLVRRGDSAQGGAQNFDLQLAGAPPDDLYLYVTYPDEQLAFQGTVQGGEWEGQYLQLSVPHRTRDVVVIGLTRVAQFRGTSAPRRPGPLLSLSFMPGSEPVYRSVSTVNEDPGSAAALSVSAGPGGGQATLRWEERNLGDYNNNGIVEITDLTPIGLNYQQKVVESPTPRRLELIDGSLDGIVNVQDLTRIGANFQRRIEGFQVYRADGLSPGPGDFEALDPGGGPPGIARSAVVAAATADQLKERLIYSYVDNGTAGNAYSWYVRAFSGDGGSDSEGPLSNAVALTLPLGNLPPVWDSSVGLSSAVGATGTDGSGALRLSFGRASDPEGTTVTYKLRYIEGQQVVGNPGTVSVDIPAADVAGDPPYIYLLERLTRGSYYTLNLQAQDADGVREFNNVSVQAKVPMLAFSNAPWANFRADALRSGCNPASQLKEPLAIEWSVELPVLGDPDAFGGAPLISAEGWTIGTDDQANNLVRYALADGAVSGPAIPTSALGQPTFDACLSVDRYAKCDALIWQLALGDGEIRSSLTPLLKQNPLLLGDFLAAGLAWDEAGSSSLGYAQLFDLAGESLALSVPGPGVTVANNISRIAVDSDGEVFIIGELFGTVTRASLLDGSVLQDGITDGGRLQGFPCLDEVNQRLFINSSVGLSSLDQDSLATQLEWPRLGDPEHGQQDAEPCLVTDVSRRLLVRGGLNGEAPDTQLRLEAIDPADLSGAWDTALPTSASVLRSLTASAQRVFALLDTELLVLDLEGRLRQRVAFGAKLAAAGEAAVANERLLLYRTGELLALGTLPLDSPPVWPSPDESGVQSLDSDCDSITVNWDSAADPDGEPVRYAIYFRPLLVPELEEPYTGTTVVPDIEDSGTGSNSFTIEALADGVRYYIAVRAYNGFWDEQPPTDGNSSVLATTTCWDSERFTLDGGAGEFSLPQGEVFALRGTVEPAAEPIPARMHLIYNDLGDGHLTHLYQDGTGSWQDEGPGLGAFAAGALEPVWDVQKGRLVIGYADQDLAGVLTRTGDDSWSQEAFASTDTVTNPMLSLAIGELPGAESALVYTELINPAFPPDEDYYYLQTSSGAWGSPQLLDSLNFSGRDLDLLLDPADSSKLWLAEQRGISYAPNRYTPASGSLYYASGDGLGGFSFGLVDAGANAPDSDCGKRVQQEISPGGLRHMAYYDLNAASDAAAGQLKYASFDGSQWQVEVVLDFDLSFQDLGGGLQYTYSELGLATCLDGGVEKPMIATLGRTFITLAPAEPHFAKVILWIRDGPDDWRYEELSEPLLVFPKDRAPCVLLRGDDGRPNIFVGSGDPAANPLKANWILHYRRQG